MSSDTHDASAYYRRNNATATTGTCVPVFYEHAARREYAVKDGATECCALVHRRARGAWHLLYAKMVLAEDACFDEEGCVSCDDDPEKWCMVDAERWCYCSTQVDAVKVPSRYVEEDQGCVLIGGLAVHDADVQFAYNRDFSEDAPWPAHFQVSAEVDDGVLALRSLNKRGRRFGIGARLRGRRVREPGACGGRRDPRR